MAVSVTLRGVRVGADSHVRCELTNGSGKEFMSVVMLKEFLSQLDGNTEMVMALVLLWCLRHDPTGANLPQFDGKTFTLDPASTTGAYIVVT